MNTLKPMDFPGLAEGGNWVLARSIIWSAFGRNSNLWRLRWLSVVFGIFWLSACKTAPPLPPVNTQEPGWIVHQGQAAWKSRKDSASIVGDLLFATHGKKQFLVQFAKIPFPTIVAQATLESWQIEFFPQHRRISRSGEPPENLVWFQLVRCLNGQLPARDWSFHTEKENGWHLENSTTGESLDGYLIP